MPGEGQVNRFFCGDGKVATEIGSSTERTQSSPSISQIFRMNDAGSFSRHRVRDRSRCPRRRHRCRHVALQKCFVERFRSIATLHALQ